MKENILYSNIICQKLLFSPFKNHNPMQSTFLINLTKAPKVRRQILASKKSGVSKIIDFLSPKQKYSLDNKS